MGKIFGGFTILIVIFILIGWLIDLAGKERKKEDEIKRQKEDEIRQRDFVEKIKSTMLYHETSKNIDIISNEILCDVLEKGKSGIGYYYNHVCYFDRGSIFFSGKNSFAIDYTLLGFDFKEDSKHRYSRLVGQMVKDYIEGKNYEMEITYDVDDNTGYSSYGTYAYILKISVAYPKEIKMKEVL